MKSADSVNSQAGLRGVSRRISAASTLLQASDSHSISFEVRPAKQVLEGNHIFEPMPNEREPYLYTGMVSTFPVERA
jgi:hypothetical protein